MAISDIGSENDNALLCHTNHPSYTSPPNPGGNWFSPNGTRITNIPGFTRNRGPMVVRLIKKGSGTQEQGVFWCTVDDADSNNQTVYIGLYNSGKGMNNSLVALKTYILFDTGIVSLPNGMTFFLNTSEEFTLTCISTGGPATTVSWTRDNVNITGEQNVTVLNNGTSAKYTHRLLVRERLEGLYKCSVTNQVSTLVSKQLYVKGKSAQINDVYTSQEMCMH